MWLYGGGSKASSERATNAAVVRAWSAAKRGGGHNSCLAAVTWRANACRSRLRGLPYGVLTSRPHERATLPTPAGLWQPSPSHPMLVKFTTTVAASRQAAWAFVAEFANIGAWDPGVKAAKKARARLYRAHAWLWKARGSF